MSEIPHLPVFPLPGSEDWAETYDWAEALEKLFPDQDAGDFAYACHYNDPGPAADRDLTNLVMTQQGARDESDWIWRVTFADGSTWIATGGCDFTGWDCQSDLVWTQEP